MLGISYLRRPRCALLKDDPCPRGKRNLVRKVRARKREVILLWPALAGRQFIKVPVVDHITREVEKGAFEIVFLNTAGWLVHRKFFVGSSEPQKEGRKEGHGLKRPALVGGKRNKMLSRLSRWCVQIATVRLRRQKLQLFRVQLLHNCVAGLINKSGHTGKSRTSLRWLPVASTHRPDGYDRRGSQWSEALSESAPYSKTLQYGLVTTILHLGGETARTKILLQPISAILTTGWRGARQKSSKIKDGFVIIIIGGFLVTQLWLDHAGNYIKVSHLASSRNPSERERL